ncbi:hypothetical protein OROMI_018014 [Orobanche minor]
MVGLSLGEQNFIKGGIAQDLRTDGRKRLTYRHISVETGVIPQASGSARVKFGATDVIASVKAELGKPNPSYPDKGNVSIYVDCSPTAEPTFEGRGDEELSAELSSALQQCLLGGKSGAGAGIDLSSLSIIEGKVCWDLYIDGLVVSSDGNVLDVLGAAIKAALSNTAIPKVQVAANAPSDEQPEVDVSNEEFLQFDTSGVPVIITLTKAGRAVSGTNGHRSRHQIFLHLHPQLLYISPAAMLLNARISARLCAKQRDALVLGVASGVGRHYIVDATTEEESQMSSAISVSLNRQGRICGLTKRGGAGLDPSVILDMISVAKHVSGQLINKLDSEIVAAEACDEDDDDEMES